jgi:hypothetical protein
MFNSKGTASADLLKKVDNVLNALKQQLMDLIQLILRQELVLLLKKRKSKLLKLRKKHLKQSAKRTKVFLQN